jgi:hypothetical protein
VTGRVAAKIGFGFDDHTAADSLGRIANQKMSEQIWRDGFGRRLVK